MIKWESKETFYHLLNCKIDLDQTKHWHLKFCRKLELNTSVILALLSTKSSNDPIKTEIIRSVINGKAGKHLPYPFFETTVLVWFDSLLDKFYIYLIFLGTFLDLFCCPKSLVLSWFYFFPMHHRLEEHFVKMERT